MRKIDKSIILSDKYKQWIEEKEIKGENHGTYTSSNHRFYIDIVMNLLHCQNGLCAYTEVQLCAIEDCSAEMWQNGKFIELEEKVNYGHLEHFDASLKVSKCWLWENLFVVSADANNAKLDTDADYILKPDFGNL